MIARIAVATISILLLSFSALAQLTCDELLEFVQSEDYGTTYYSFGSDAIREVTFHSVSVDYDTYYFAVVKFSNNFYNEYIYQVSSETKRQYSYNYLTSAGEAFWKYIQPYADQLGYGPDF